MSTKGAYLKKLQAQLDEWESEIGRLKDLADKADAVLKLSYYNQIEELLKKQESVGGKLEVLSLAEDDVWENLKSNIESTCKDLGEAIKEAASRFR